MSPGGLLADRPPRPRRSSFRRWLRFATRHHDATNLFSSLVGLAAASILSIVALKISNDQRRIQEATVLPLISVQLLPNSTFTSSLDLVVQNFGGPLNHLQAESWDFIAVDIVPEDSRDTISAIFEVFNYVGSVASTGHPQGVVARSPDAAGAQTLDWQQRPSEFMADSVLSFRLGVVRHIVHLSYDDLFEKHHDRYVIVDSRDFSYVDARATRELRDSIRTRSSRGDAIGFQRPSSDWAAVAKRGWRSARSRDATILRALKIPS